MTKFPYRWITFLPLSSLTPSPHYMSPHSSTSHCNHHKVTALHLTVVNKEVSDTESPTALRRTQWAQIAVIGAFKVASVKLSYLHLSFKVYQDAPVWTWHKSLDLLFSCYFTSKMTLYFYWLTMLCSCAIM